MGDPGVIRNRMKIEAAIHNAHAIQRMRAEHRGFAAWLDAHHPRPKEEWVKLFKKTYRFTGVEIVNEFLTSTGYLPGAHEPECALYARVVAAGGDAKRILELEVPDINALAAARV